MMEKEVSRVFTSVLTDRIRFKLSLFLESDPTLAETVPVEVRSKTVPVELSG